jgi:hypothetical protein
MSFIKYACKCGQLCHKNNLCGHGINAGVCCTCYECLAELEDSDYGEEEEEEEHPAHKFFEERDCAYCRVFFEQGKDNCKECGFDLNSWNKEEEECCNCWEFADCECKCDCHSVVEDSDDEEEEVHGVCWECGTEGKFIGKEGDEWRCHDCSTC